MDPLVERSIYDDYYPWTEFTFGKYKGKRFKDVIQIDLPYIGWCILHLDCFLPRLEYFKDHIKENPNYEFLFSDKVLSEKIKDKLRYFDKQKGRIRTYYQYTEFDFGKYNGRIVKEIMKIDPDYIKWCILNLNHFYLDVSKAKQKKYPNLKYILSKDVDNKLEEKWNALADQFGSYNTYDFRNNPYYREDLDMDQQDQRFWDG